MFNRILLPIFLLFFLTLPNLNAVIIIESEFDKETYLVHNYPPTFETINAIYPQLKLDLFNGILGTKLGFLLFLPVYNYTVLRLYIHPKIKLSTGIDFSLTRIYFSYTNIINRININSTLYLTSNLGMGLTYVYYNENTNSPSSNLQFSFVNIFNRNLILRGFTSLSLSTSDFLSDSDLMMGT